MDEQLDGWVGGWRGRKGGRGGKSGGKEGRKEERAQLRNPHAPLKLYLPSVLLPLRGLLKLSRPDYREMFILQEEQLCDHVNLAAVDNSSPRGSLWGA